MKWGERFNRSRSQARPVDHSATTSARAAKRIDSLALVELLDVAGELEAELSGQDVVSRALVGKVWLVFTAMLTEADYGSEPEPLLNAAWNYQDRLRKLFGPTF